jgi:hypothetical protein
LVVTIALLFPACAVQEKPPAAPPSVVTPAPSPEVTYIVRTDYAHLTPYEPVKEVYTRLSEEFMPELIPSDDYGPLLPYAGVITTSTALSPGTA